MSQEVMITLDKVPRFVLGVRKYNALVREHGGEDAEWDKPFPVSTILDSFGLMEALLCMTALPDYKWLVVDFAIFCATRVSKDPRAVDKEKIIKSVDDFYRDKSGTLKLCQFDEIHEKAFYSGEDAFYNSEVTGNILIEVSEYRKVAREVTYRSIIDYEEEKQEVYFRALLDDGGAGVG